MEDAEAPQLESKSLADWPGKSSSEIIGGNQLMCLIPKRRARSRGVQFRRMAAVRSRICSGVGSVADMSD